MGLFLLLGIKYGKMILNCSLLILIFTSWIIMVTMFYVIACKKDVDCNEKTIAILWGKIYNEK